MSEPQETKMMDIEPGGEQTAYEGEASDMIPPSKVPGQFGGGEKSTSVPKQNKASNEPNTQGVTPADKIRYGQSIQEGGAGGKTEGMSGEARTEGGFGGTDALNQDAQDEGFAKERREQGYGGDNEMRRDVGA